MTRSASLSPWDVPGHLRAGAALLHGPLQANELERRLQDDWRNVNRRITRLLSIGVVVAGPGSTRERLISLAPGEADRVEAALTQDAAERALTNQIGKLRPGQTLVTVRVTADLMDTFRRVIARQAATSPPAWAARTHGHADWVFAFDDAERGDSGLLLAALQQAGVECSSLSAGTVFSAEGFRRYLLAAQEAADAARRDSAD